MYKIKEKPEDFIVKEISNIEIKDEGKYSYWELKKRQYTTIRAIQTVARHLNIPSKFIGFAGNKDKQAITEQIISIRNYKKQDTIKLKDITLEFLGYGDERINLGQLEGNRFEITIRNIDEIKPIQVPNYFDEQRFSTNNIEIGKSIVKKYFKKACSLIDHPKAIEHLKQHPNDYVNAIKRIPKRIARIYVHAYQSYLWNEKVSNLLKKYKHKTLKTSFGTLTFPLEKIKQTSMPIPGFGNGHDEFVIRQIPYLSAEGDERELLSEVKNLEIKKQENKIILKFDLKKGSYATMVVKAFTL